MQQIPDSARERLEPLVREWSSASDYPRLFGLVCGIVDFHHPPLWNRHTCVLSWMSIAACGSNP